MAPPKKSVASCHLLAWALLAALLAGSLPARAQDPMASMAAAASGNIAAGSSMIVGIERLQSQIDQLSQLSDTPPDVTRVLFTPKDLAARRFVHALMLQANLTVRDDAVGNIFGRWEGTASGVVATGSHTDAIPNSGKYDGVVGVLGAIEAIHALKSTGFQPKKSIEVIMFTSEEPTRFGIGCLGSRVMAADPGIVEKLKAAVDSDGISFEAAAAKALHPDAIKKIDDVKVKSGTYAAFVELHIEQGPILEAQGDAIGIVTAIAAPASLKVDFYGEGGHAGGLLMADRHDAGLAAAELALAVEKHVLESGSNDTVGTTGVADILPGAINSVPRHAHLEIDVRDIDGKRRDSVVAKIQASAAQIAEKRGVNVTVAMVNQDPPAICSDWVTKAVGQSAESLGLKARPMPSRAYHDALLMSRIAPTAMIFIPCYKGYSHRPDEFASKEAIQNGVSTLALTLAKLSMEDPPSKKWSWFW